MMICEEVMGRLRACAEGKRAMDRETAADAGDAINLLLGVVGAMREQNAEDTEVFQAALDTWGADAQILMAFEEMSELQKALCKMERCQGRVQDIAEEIADVEIMLEQMKLLFRCGGMVMDERRLKINRLKRRISETKTRQGHAETEGEQ